ncbi:MAG: hypothetical protein WC797_02700 [Candidatus Paceibacterota bacterium]|jgi:hypothetical protein
MPKGKNAAKPSSEIGQADIKAGEEAVLFSRALTKLIGAFDKELTRLGPDVARKILSDEGTSGLTKLVGGLGQSFGSMPGGSVPVLSRRVNQQSFSAGFVPVDVRAAISGLAQVFGKWFAFLGPNAVSMMADSKMQEQIVRFFMDKYRSSDFWWEDNGEGTRTSLPVLTFDRLTSVPPETGATKYDDLFLTRKTALNVGFVSVAAERVLRKAAKQVVARPGYDIARFTLQRRHSIDDIFRLSGIPKEDICVDLAAVASVVGRQADGRDGFMNNGGSGCNFICHDCVVGARWRNMTGNDGHLLNDYLVYTYGFDENVHDGFDLVFKADLRLLNLHEE